MSTTKRRCSSTRTGSHRTKKSQPQKAPERSDDNPFQMLQENKTARLLTKDQIASGAMSSEDLEQILEEAVRTHSAETVSLLGRMMLEDFQQEMKAFSLFDWQPERMNHLTEPLQIYLGIQHILRSTKDLPKVDSMNAAEMEHNSLQGNFFWLSCYGQGGKNYFRSIVPTLDNSSSAAWHSHRQQMRDYSDRFQNRLRFLFTFFLNCPDAPTRSCSLGWIAQVANKNKARTQLVYQEIGVVPPYQGWEATNPGPDSPETLVPLRADRRTLASDQQAREMLGKLSSPAMLVSLCRMLTQMILAIRRSGKQEGSFDLFSALLMPNMVDTSQETRWGVNRTELQAIQIQKRQNFASSCQEDRDSATRGLLLFYTLKHLEVGLLPELAKLKQIQDSVRQSPQSTELLAAMFIREAQLLDPTFVNEVVELCVFILKIFVHGLRHHPEQVVVFPESFLTTIINCFTEITCLVPQHRFFVGQQDDLVSVCSSLLQLLVTDQSIRSLRLRSSIITLLHRWLHVQSPIRPVDGVAFFDHPSLLEHFPKLLQFAAQNAAAVTATEAQPSVENIFVRKMIVYLGRSKVPLEKMLAVPHYQDLFSSWCTEVLSYIGAALQSIKTLRQLETGPDFEPLHPHYARLVSRAQKFVADFFCMLLLLTNISEQQASFFTPIIGDVSNLIQYVLAFIVEHPLPLNLICAEQIQFLPSAVLECICRLSLQLSGPHFNFALASEDSFVKEVLPRLVPLLRQYYIHGDMIAAFEKLCHSVRQISHLLKEADPPDEFYDPLVNTIMKDPVILPTSQVIIDRNTILRLLKVSPLDPYTRTPLSAEQLEPASALKSQLDQFWTRLLVL